MARKPTLVTQHLEGVSRELLEEHQEIVRRYVRARNGVYALYSGKRLYYVGLATDLRNRLSHHLKDRHHDSWDRFSVYLTIGDDHLRELEALILRIVNPPGNKQRGRFPKAEDLRKHFRKDLNQELRRVIDDFLPNKPRRPAKPTAIPKTPDGRKPVLADYATKKLTLRAHHKGKTLWAYVRKSGLIWFNQQHFTSPSLAGASAVGRPTCNGWTLWHYQRSPGDWVPLDTLRK